MMPASVSTKGTIASTERQSSKSNCGLPKKKAYYMVYNKQVSYDAAFISVLKVNSKKNGNFLGFTNIKYDLIDFFKDESFP